MNLAKITTKEKRLRLLSFFKILVFVYQSSSNRYVDRKHSCVNDWMRITRAIKMLNREVVSIIKFRTSIGRISTQQHVGACFKLCVRWILAYVVCSGPNWDHCRTEWTTVVRRSRLQVRSQIIFMCRDAYHSTSISLIRHICKYQYRPPKQQFVNT